MRQLLGLLFQREVAGWAMIVLFLAATATAIAGLVCVIVGEPDDAVALGVVSLAFLFISREWNTSQQIY